MTISSTTRIAGPFVGNDTATAFPFAFKVFTASEIQVARTNSAGVESTLALDTDYTVTLNGNQDNNPGGTVTLPAVLATGYKLTITSSIAPLQATELHDVNGGTSTAIVRVTVRYCTVVTTVVSHPVVGCNGGK